MNKETGVTVNAERAARIGALPFDYVAQPKAAVDTCNLCGGTRFVVAVASVSVPPSPVVGSTSLLAPPRPSCLLPLPRASQGLLKCLSRRRDSQMDANGHDASYQEWKLFFMVGE